MEVLRHVGTMIKNYMKKIKQQTTPNKKLFIMKYTGLGDVFKI